MSHRSETYHLRRSWFVKEIYSANYANDAFFLYAYDVLKRDNPDLSYLSEEDREKVVTYMDDLDQFNSYFVLMDELHVLINGFSHLQIDQHKRTSLSNVFSQEKFIKDVSLMEFKELIAEYNRIIQELEEFPEWKEKVKKECEKYITWYHIFNHNNEKKDEVTPDFNKHNHFM